jgi:hypothetical protein
MSAAIIRQPDPKTESDISVEKWRAIPGYSGYEVSSWGRVRSFRHRRFGATSQPAILKLGVAQNGYLRVQLCPSRRKHHVARLVLSAFVGPRPDNQQVRHFPDRTVTNNRLDNIQWGTARENYDDIEIHGTRPRGARHWSKTLPDRVVSGSRVGTSKLTEADVVLIRRLRKEGIGPYALGKRFGVHRKTITRICAGRTWKHITTKGR